MNRDDITVEVRGVELDGSGHPLARRGIITPGFLDLSGLLRWSNVGEWKLTLPGEHPMVPYLSMAGSGLVVSIGDDEWWSGPTTAPGRKRDRKNPDGTFTFAGVTDEIHLADALAYPQPSNANPALQAVTNDVRSGPVETLLYQYVGANIGPAAPAGRKGDSLRQYITLGTDLARGITAQKSPRFQGLLELLQELAVLDTGMGFRVVQRGLALRFEVVPTADRTDTVRLDIENGTLTSEEAQRTGPTITRAIVAGQGEGTARQIVTRTTTAATDAEGLWGRRIERFIDQRNTNETTELEQAGDEALNAAGFTATNVKVIPADDTMRYGSDWWQGDRITVVVSGQETQADVTAAAFIVNKDACKVGAAIGDVSGFDTQAALTQRVDDIDQRLGRLERTEQSEAFVPDLGDPGADRVLIWDDSAGAYAYAVLGAPMTITGTTISVAAATTADAGVTRYATSAQAVTGTALDLAMTPAADAAAMAAFGYSKAQMNAGQMDTRYYTEAEVDAQREYDWQRVVPSSVTNTGGSASRDATTGLVTITGACTILNVLGVFASGYDYLIVTREFDSFTAYTDNMNLTLLVGSTLQNASNYYMIGDFRMYDGSTGGYIANAQNTMPIGNGYTAGGEVHRRLEVLQPNEARNTLFPSLWNYAFGAARKVEGVGSYNNNAQATGFRMSAGTGSFNGTVQVLRRKALI